MKSPSRRERFARVRFSVSELEYGMFVSELDRPWLDTPFALQGLLLGDRAQLDALRTHCRFVYVDLARSSAVVADTVRRAALAAAAQDAPAETDATASAAGASPLARLLAWLHRVFARAPTGRATDGADEPKRTPAARRRTADFDLPPDIRLEPYPAPAPMHDELPRAARSWSRGKETLRSLMDDLREGGRADLRDIDQVTGELVESMIETPDAMMWVARMRDEQHSTYQHCLKVALYLVALGRQMGFPRAELVRLGQIGMLADVGKIRLPEALIDKRGMLTPTEHALVRTHVQLSIAVLRKSMPLDPLVEQGILQHHERLDGSGYPHGLKGREIGIYGRMAAIADSFAALTSERPYSGAMAPQDALMRLYEWSGASFHEPLVEQLVQAIGVFPIGSLVELSSGEVAIVLAHNRVHRLEPRVLVIAGTDKQPLDRPFERDLLAEAATGAAGDPQRRSRIARGLPAGAYGLNPGDYYADELASSCDGLAIAGA
ncbi:MAG: HD-GYP domain-containing protein [Burkholderiaceae bacterium]|nr:HD-GYP domain-containing protein [Burkholderiaceae bacterium]